MSKNFEPLVPRDILELMDHLSMMLVKAPRFALASSPPLSIEQVFFELNAGLTNIREVVGDDSYATLAELSERAKVLFETDPDDTSGDTRAGRQLILQMWEHLRPFAERP